jgi:protoporphyrin/coproporphyrin ferrochelatase
MGMSDNPWKTGVLLANTGTTEAPKPAETRTYLREFLSDSRVLDTPAPIRWLVLNLFILPFRPKQSAEAYAEIWTPEGSPLLVITRELQRALEERMPEHVFAIGMRYGRPSLREALERLLGAGVERIVVAPLFPQYASAATGSVLERVFDLASERWNVPSLSCLPPFYAAEEFLDSWKAVAEPLLNEFQPDHVVLSYHGLPERHVKKSDTSGNHCLVKPDCCETIVAANQHCYRAQCFATSRGIMARLGLGADQCTTTFQSRLGRDPWLQPATDEVIPSLPGKGVKRLAVLCPAFTADCLETLEEIGIRAQESFLEAGGQAFQLVPCLNSHPAWADALAGMLGRL